MKLKRTLIIIGAIILLVVSYGIGRSSASTELNGQKAKYDDIVKKTFSVQKDLTDVKKDVKEVQAKAKDLESQFDSRKAQFDQAAELAGKADSLQSDIDSKTATLNGITDKINSSNSDITAKQAELDKLTTGVKTKQEEPRTFSAGQYVVGKDFPSGRYKAVPVGEGSNFFIYDGSSSSAKVNTILGHEAGFSEAEYIFYCSENDIMETHSSVKLIAVE